ncbi:MAG: heparinase II/III family protein [Anaerolineae bacterium]|nr:heparinase II/III family protein [Anaerolineae bacterium]
MSAKRNESAGASGLSRRAFIARMGCAAAGLWQAACRARQPQESETTPAPTVVERDPTGGREPSPQGRAGTPFLPASEILAVLERTAPGWALYPELDAARADPERLGERMAAQWYVRGVRRRSGGYYPIPQTTYTLYGEFERTGQRSGYEDPYFDKRRNLTAATISLLLQGRSLEVIHDYLWAICEESDWVVPAHAPIGVDLFSSETAFHLAETVTLLADALDPKVIARVEREIEERVLAPYMADHDRYWWYKGSNNWNGVCNGAVGSTFLLLERDNRRLAEALALALAGIKVYVAEAFEPDGASTEGVGYWQYGLMNVVCLGELLRQRTKGEIDLLAGVPELGAIARYPLAVMLSPGRFASFSDSAEAHSFHPGLVTWIAERTGERDVAQILAGPGMQTSLPMRLAMALRTMAWWDESWPDEVALHDVHLADAGIVRLVLQVDGGAPLVVVLKAGHNDENHNHNDVGSFIVHAGGETFLCDPGAGLYTRQYFGSERYENAFTNSFGHSVPVVDGALQSAGRSFEGKVTAYAPDETPKRAAVEMSGAYQVRALRNLNREMTIGGPGLEQASVTLTDVYAFSAAPASIEEAFVTWLDVEVDRGEALIRGERGVLHAAIEAPHGAVFSLANLERESLANRKAGVLKRLTVDLPPERDVQFAMRLSYAPLQ